MNTQTALVVWSKLCLWLSSACKLLLVIVPPLHIGGRTLGLHALRSASSSEARDKFCCWPWSLRYTWVAARSGFMPSTARAPVKLGTMCRPVNFQDLIDRPPIVCNCQVASLWNTYAAFELVGS